MDLSTMLNDEPMGESGPVSIERTVNFDDPAVRDRAAILQLSTALQFIVTADSKRNTNRRSYSTVAPFHDNRPTLAAPARAPIESAPMPPPTCPKLGPETARAPPDVWSPRISLERVIQEQPLLLDRQFSGSNGTSHFQLVPCEIIFRGDEPRVFLEESYQIEGAYPRGFFVAMAKRELQHNFVFRHPDHPYFEDLYGLRRSAYFTMRTETGEQWELHLKASRDKMFLFGYLCKHDALTQIVKDSVNVLLSQRRLPLVLDLDDTLVRAVGDEGSKRQVPEKDLPHCGNRVAVLRDGRRVVMTERVHEFLEWAQNYYDISVCSLGDQNYVDNVVNALDPQRTRIRGVIYSARSEHDYIKRSPDPSRPPKDLTTLYSFCALRDKSIGSEYTLPLIVDDETRMWPQDQHDNIVVVTQQSGALAWNVSLFPVVQEVLAHVHQEFFRQFDNWVHRQSNMSNRSLVPPPPPSAVNIYKAYLRSLLRDKIAQSS
ncbi:hypothetical protein VTP01DRAFT_5706 [Rhizomucor pusillus]|uniref:uncharacterized protein n=1 Tax=Rhizomucor pusillus TaxID=4840 RepID=UPI0037442D14